MIGPGLDPPGLAPAMAGLVTLALADSLALAMAGLLATGIGVGLPYAAVFNGPAASVPASPAAAQGFVGWGGTLTAVVGPPLVGQLLDVSGGFASGFLVLAAFTALVLLATRALHPFAFSAEEAIRGRRATWLSTILRSLSGGAVLPHPPVAVDGCCRDHDCCARQVELQQTNQDLFVAEVCGPAIRVPYG